MEHKRARLCWPAFVAGAWLAVVAIGACSGSESAVTNGQPGGPKGGGTPNGGDGGPLGGGGGTTGAGGPTIPTGGGGSTGEVCSRLVPESVAPAIACTPKQLGNGYDGCSESNTACGSVHGCLVERNETIDAVVTAEYAAPPAGFKAPATLLPPMGSAVTGKGSGWFSRGDGTLATGSCTFPPVKNIMVAALISQQFGNADWCGACAEVVGRAGTRARIMIVDQCAGCAPGGLDLAAGADSPYSMLNLPGGPDVCGTGLQPITWKVVPCETEGGIVLHYVEGYNTCTPAVQVRNHRLPLVKLEQKYGGAWNTIQRQAWNVYVLQGSCQPVDITLRMTAADGSTITAAFPPYQAGSSHEASAQF